VRLAPASTENDERLLLVMSETINDELQNCQIEIARIQKLKINLRAIAGWPDRPIPISFLA
jgi:hypothetical protein